MWPVGQTGCRVDSVTMETSKLVTEIIHFSLVISGVIPKLALVDRCFFR